MSKKSVVSAMNIKPHPISSLDFPLVLHLSSLIFLTHHFAYLRRLDQLLRVDQFLCLTAHWTIDQCPLELRLWHGRTRLLLGLQLTSTSYSHWSVAFVALGPRFVSSKWKSWIHGPWYWCLAPLLQSQLILTQELTDLYLSGEIGNSKSCDLYIVVGTYH